MEIIKKYLFPYEETVEIIEKAYQQFSNCLQNNNVELLKELFDKKLIEYDQFKPPLYQITTYKIKQTALNFFFVSIGHGYITQKHVDILCILLKQGANIHEKSFQGKISKNYPNHFIWLCNEKITRWISMSRKALHIIDIFLKAGANINYYEEYNEYNSVLFNVVNGYIFHKEQKKSHTTGKSFIKSKNSAIHSMIIRKLILHGHNLNEPKMFELVDSQKHVNKKKTIYEFFRKELPNLFLLYCFKKKSMFVFL
jgi:hypothetical protein